MPFWRRSDSPALASSEGNMPEGDDLTPIAPEEAVELYLDHREDELSDKSIMNQRYRLESFVQWCDEEGIDNLNDLTGRDLHRFRVWRSRGEGEYYDEVAKVTLRGILGTLRKFLEYAATIEAVESGMRERVLLPDLDDGEASRDEMLEPERAPAILEHLDRFQYASHEHVIMAIFWHTGVRLGGLRALDVGDFHADDRALELRHRPESDTPLKNGVAAERYIALDQHYVDVLRDYIQTNRHDVTDDYGRRPLITSKQGRLTAVPIRVRAYRWTQPCQIGDCPHGKDPKTCEWRNRERLSECPSSRSPHGVRRGAITRMLQEGVPDEVVSERVNSSPDVLDEHYDQRTEVEKMQLRREFLPGVNK